MVHLRRDFQAKVDWGNAGSALGEELLRFAEDVFTQWYLVRVGTIRRSTMRQHVDYQRSWFRAQLGVGRECGCEDGGVGRDLLRLEPALWKFTWRVGVEPRNNAVERDFRHAGSGGGPATGRRAPRGAGSWNTSSR